MADPPVGTGLNDLVILHNRHVDSEEAAEFDDRPPAQDQSGGEENRTENTAQLPAWKDCATDVASDKQAGCDTRQNHHPKHTQRASILPFAVYRARAPRHGKRYLRD